MSDQSGIVRARGRGRGQPRGQVPGTQPSGGRGDGRGVGGPWPAPPAPASGSWGGQRPQVAAPVGRGQRPAAPAWGGQRPPAPTPQPTPQATQGNVDVSSLTTTVSEMHIGDVVPANVAASGRGNRRGAGRVMSDNTEVTKTRNPTLNSKKGVTGSNIRLNTNHFAFVTHLKWCLYHYHVDMSPEEDRTFMRKNLMNDHRAKLKGYLFDGTALYTPFRLNPDIVHLYSKRVHDGETIKITLTLVGDLSPGDYHYIQVFNILMRRCYEALKLQLMGRDYFDAQAKIDIKEYKLQVWPGYKTTISQFENDILMIAEITHKVLRVTTVHDMLRDYSNTKGSNFMAIFKEDIVGQVILTDYNNKTYNVDDVTTKVTPNSTFNMKGEDVTYVAYYKKKYNLTIRDYSQPMLVSKAKARDVRAGMSEFVFLVPEFCRLTGLSTEMRNDFHLMRALSSHTRVDPRNRVKKLMDFNKRIQTTPACINILREWDMVLDNKLVEISGRRLPQEVILQGRAGEKAYNSGETNEGWTREVRSKPMLKCATVSRWVVIVPSRIRREVDNFVGMIIKASQTMDFKLPNPIVEEIPHDNITVYVEKLEQVISSLSPNIIVCTTTNDRSDRYSALKKKCYVDRAIPMQVITGRSINNKNAMSIATKVAIQINCKLGGAPWGVRIPLNNVMIVGYDVCHDAQLKSKSFGAMIASMDRAMSNYFSTVTPHVNGEELSNSFGMNMKLALQQYREINNVLPSHIVIYRDGVGDGLVEYVVQHELMIIKKALQDMYGGNNFKLGFIIVSKRLNTRIFMADSYNNPLPGTVVDDVITNPDRYDFFLISQAVRDGTVGPTSYNIIFDNLGLTPDQIQKLTYKLCHLYYNFCGQVRVPAVCQYAHKLAFLTGQNLHLQPNLGLGTLLFFL